MSTHIIGEGFRAFVTGLGGFMSHRFFLTAILFFIGWKFLHRLAHRANRVRSTVAGGGD